MEGSNACTERVKEDSWILPLQRQTGRSIFSILSERRYAGYVFLAPALIYLIAFSVYPLLYSIDVSLRQYIISKPYLGMPWVGLENFRRVLTDSHFHYSLAATLYFTVAAVTIELLLGLGIALLLNRSIPGIGIIRTIVVIPMMIAPVVVGLSWKYMLDYDTGVVNYFIRQLGIQPPNWLGDAKAVIPALVITDVWEWTPLFVLLLLAGLQAMPQEPFEAAKVDGASSWQTFVHLTLPFLRPFILIALLLRVIDSLRTFDIPFVMTAGGPGRATEFASLYAYRQAFSYYYVSVGIAAAFIILIVITILSNLLVRALPTPEVEG
jgi:multiple sugar transport system permease protein